MADIPGMFAGMDGIVLLAVFAVFIFAAYKFVKFLMKAALFAFVGALFPVFMGFMGYGEFFGYQMGFNLYSMLIFSAAAVVLLVVYSVASAVLGVGGAIFGKRPASRGDVRELVKKEIEKEKK
jgi:hypothetical protein